MKQTLFWFRRDLRTHDNAGLSRALQSGGKVTCIFVFDRAILDALPNKADRRVEFIHASVAELKDAIESLGGELIVSHAFAAQEIPSIARKLNIDQVFANEDYEPAARKRDATIAAALAENGVSFHLVKDTVIFEKSEILTQVGGTFSVFTPYKRAWLKRLADRDLAAHEVASFARAFAKPPKKSAMPALAAMGFLPTNIKAHITPGMGGADAAFGEFLSRIAGYDEARNFPAIKGVSYLGVHNRFGTISVRALARAAYAQTIGKSNPGAETWLAELIWREFYFQILWHHPHAATGAFRPMYDAIAWRNDARHFAAWCNAHTGYPIIDAAMRQINQTGYMHNRLRMIVASFLTKDLLIDWRLGEKYFADNLNDFDQSANNGGWQWAASTGCDAQPYFRIFNPVTQSERFDPAGKFIRRYVPELADVPDKFIHAPWTMPPLARQAIGLDARYPAPIVDHAVEREKALAMYKAVREA